MSKTIKKELNDGRTIDITYEGIKNGSALFTSSKNEGIDQEIEVTFKEHTTNKVIKKKIIQEGMREIFGDFKLIDNQTFNVLKDGIRIQ